MDLAYARGWLSERQHRTGALLEALYRRAGLPPAGIRPPASYEVDDGLKTSFRAFAELADDQVVEIWDAVFNAPVDRNDREAAAAEAMRLYRALMAGLPAAFQSELYWVCVAQSWPQWVVWRAAGKPIPAGHDAGRRRLEEALGVVAARWREIRPRPGEGSARPADANLSDVPPQWSFRDPGVRLAK